MVPPSDQSPAAPARRTSRSLKWIAVAVWLAMLIGLYIVIVRLKLGGPEAIRDGRKASAPAAVP